MNLLSRQGARLGAVAIAAALKAVVLAVCFAAFVAIVGRAPSGVDELVDKWDVANYLEIAARGYADARPELIVYPPLFPLLIAAVGVVTRDLAMAGLVVTLFGAAASAFLLEALARREIGSESASNAVLALLFFPTAYTLHLPFSESVFLSFVLAAFLAARSGRWAAAGLLGALATLTRSAGLVLLPALAAFALTRGTAATGRRGVVWLVSIPAAFLVYLALNASIRGDPFAFAQAYSAAWGKRLDAPWVGLGHLIGLATDPTNAWPLWWLEIAFVVIGLAVAILAAIRLPAPYAVWTFGSWLLFVSTSIVVSVPRYTITLFPLFLLTALPMRSRPWRLVIVSVGLALQLFLAARFAIGLWAY